jgi:hypothetical protein
VRENIKHLKRPFLGKGNKKKSNVEEKGQNWLCFA